MRSYFFSLTLFCSTMSNNNASESVAGKVDLKFIMEALTSEVKRIFKAELEQFHERVEQSFNVTPQISGGLFFFFFTGNLQQDI